jgi:hypothetical protein
MTIKFECDADPCDLLSKFSAFPFEGERIKSWSCDCTNGEKYTGTIETHSAPAPPLVQYTKTGAAEYLGQLFASLCK